MMQEIETRRSIRKYSYEVMNEEDLQKILEAGRLSPSAKNKQPWEFVVITNQEVKREIAQKWEDKLERENPTSEALRNCSVAIVIFNSLEDDDWNIFSLGICAENMMLEATHLGYGSLCVGLTSLIEEDIKRICNIEHHHLAIICVGKSSEEPEAPSRKELHEFVTYIR